MAGSWCYLTETSSRSYFLLLLVQSDLIHNEIYLWGDISNWVCGLNTLKGFLSNIFD